MTKSFSKKLHRFVDGIIPNQNIYLNKNKVKNFLVFILVLAVSLLIWPKIVKIIQANFGAKIQFTADAKIDLSGIDSTLYALKDSECDSLTLGDPDFKTLKVDIPNLSSFTLGTADHNILKLTPSGGMVSLTASSDYFSSGYVSQWTETSKTSNLSVDHLVGVFKTHS